MKELLETFFGTYYHSTKQATADSKILQGLMEFADSKACDDCRRHDYELATACDNVVLKCDSSGQLVEVIEFEQFIDQYSYLKALPSKRKCDLLLVGNEKIVFCDMTCSRAKYIGTYVMSNGNSKIGKRMVAMEQIRSSVGLLLAVPEIANDISMKKERIALFAYRMKPNSIKDGFDSNVSKSMSSLSLVERKILQQPMYIDIGNGFMFTEICYPETYIW